MAATPPPRLSLLRPQFLIKPYKSISTLEAASDSLSVPIRLFTLILTKTLDNIHNHIPIPGHNPKTSHTP
jgi:hypothetical protein